MTLPAKFYVEATPGAYYERIDFLLEAMGHEPDDSETGRVCPECGTTHTGETLRCIGCQVAEAVNWDVEKAEPIDDE